MSSERLEITLPAELKRRLERRAQADLVSFAKVTRAALESYFARDYRSLVRNLILSETKSYRRAAEDSKDGSFDFPDAFARQVGKIFGWDAIFGDDLDRENGRAVDLCRELGLDSDDGSLLRVE